MLTSDLLTDIERRAAIPLAQTTFQSTDIYQMIDRETESKMTPLILRCMSEYMVADYPYNITAGQALYAIPSRAVAGKLRDVQIIQSNNPDSISPLQRLDFSDLYASTSGTFRVLVQKTGFYIEGNYIRMYPTPQNTSNIINLSYYIRPNTCVDPSMCAQIQSINTSTNVVTVVSAPANITTSTPIDFVNALPGFECKAINQVITNVGSNTYTFSSLPGNLSVGDYVCQATQTCVVQIPQELLGLLSQYVTVRVLSAQGDAQAYQQALNELKTLEENAMMLIAPRVDGKLVRVTNSKGISRFV